MIDPKDLECYGDTLAEAAALIAEISHALRKEPMSRQMVAIRSALNRSWADVTKAREFIERMTPGECP